MILGGRRTEQCSIDSVTLICGAILDHALALVVIESYDPLGPTRLHLEIVSASAMPGVDFDVNYDVSPSIDLVKQLTQSVEQLSLRMDTGGWVLAVDLASRLGITTDDLKIRARHYPSECIEFSMWKDSSDPDVAHLRAIRASTYVSTRGSESTGWECRSA